MKTGARPAFVTDIDGGAPLTAVWRGSQFSLTALPVGSHVCYAPEPETGVTHVRNAARTAVQRLRNDDDPTATKPTAATKVAIVVGTSRFTAFETQQDPRRLLTEELVESLAKDGVDDIIVLLARGTRPRLTEAQLVELLGERVVNAFVPHGLLQQHNIDDEQELVEIDSQDGIPVVVNRHIHAADITYVIDLAPTYGTTELDTLLDLVGSQTRQALLDDVDEEKAYAVQNAIAKHVNARYAFGVHNGNTLPEALAFTNGREREWSLLERTKARSLASCSSLTPSQVLRKAFSQLRVTVRTVSFYAGTRDEVFADVRNCVTAQSEIPLSHAYDVVSIGVSPSLAPRPGLPVDPLTAASSALQIAVSHNTAQSCVRHGGVVIIHHDFLPKFDSTSHGPSSDFFLTLDGSSPGARHALPHTTIEKHANDAWYQNISKNAFSAHGLYPLEQWTRITRALSRISNVLVVGGEPSTVRRMGFRPSSTLADAVELSRDIVGELHPSFLHVHGTMSPQFRVDA